MKTAKEMFEELGYKCIADTNYDIIFQKGNQYTSDGIKIDFDLDLDAIKIEFLMDKCRWFSFEELQAINKMVSELGWNE